MPKKSKKQTEAELQRALEGADLTEEEKLAVDHELRTCAVCEDLHHMNGWMKHVEVEATERCLEAAAKRKVSYVV